MTAADIHALIERALKADKACRTIGELEQENERLREALQWYADTVLNCRKLGGIREGEEARAALNSDGGERARAALEAKP